MAAEEAGKSTKLEMLELLRSTPTERPYAVFLSRLPTWSTVKPITSVPS
jgi:hypothetical protein